MNTIYQDDNPVKCNNCDWVGTELQLIVTSGGDDACPNCKWVGFIMDIKEGL